VTGPPDDPEQLLGIRVTATGHGWAEAEMPVPAGASADDPMPAGFVGMLADVALGRTVLTALPPGGGCRTATLHLDFAGPPLVEGETLAVRSSLLTRQHALALATGTVTVCGRVAARCSGWFAVLGPDGEADPYADDAGAARPPGADLARLRELTRLTAQDAGPGHFAAEVKAGQELANRYQIVHGGMQVVLMEAALSATARGAVRGGRILGLDITLHRPVPVDGSRLRATGRVVRAGRRVLSAEAAITDTDGRLLIAATGTFDVSAAGRPDQ
jgi:uncharacterized protein (TIGR00369 family)